MIGSAYIKDGEINLRFEWFIKSKEENSQVDSVSYELGTFLLDFMWLSPELTLDIFENLKSLFFTCRANHEDYDSTINSFQPYLQLTLKSNLYLFFYVKEYIEFLMHGSIDTGQSLQEIKSYLLDDFEVESVEFSDISALAHWSEFILLDDIKKRQKLLIEDLDAISGETPAFAECSPLQRLYLLEISGKNYLSGTFKTMLSPDFAFDETDDMDAIKSSLISNKVDIVEMVDIDTFSDLIRFEIYNIIKSGLNFKRCRYCGGYFIPRGRTDIEYCNRIKTGEKKRCSEIGAFRVRNVKLKENPIHKAYIQAYHRMDSRKRQGSLSQEKFQDWNWQALDRRDKCLAGEINIEEYQEWLDLTKFKFK
jgi:hypothetical protein